MKVRLAVAVVVLAMTACVAAVCRQPGKPSSINFDSYQQIQKGMTRKQVEVILDGPSRNESANPDGCPGRAGTWLHQFPVEWWGPDYAIFIWFDCTDTVVSTVVSKKFEAHRFGPAQKPSLWDQARSRLPWSRSPAPN
jgi:hypothetical protein